MYGFIAKINDCYVSGVYPPKVVPTCSQNIIVLLSLGLFAKESSSTIIEFLCIALLEVEINEVKDC